MNLEQEKKTREYFLNMKKNKLNNQLSDSLYLIFKLI
jgi:hypothetical protein